VHYLGGVGKRQDLTDDPAEIRSGGPGSAATEVGRRLRSLRTGQAWTLDELASRSGVSRRMIVNLEQGSANASIGTLLRLGSAFGVALSELVEGLESSRPVGSQVRRAGERSVLWSGEHGGEAVMVASAKVPDMVELWDWTLGPGDAHESDAHAPGTRELIHVVSGLVRVSVGEDEAVDLATGDAVSFPGDRPHGYSNPGRSKARFALTVYEPVRRTR
jgi:transcriptional regulator with XRE-family HTH domain